MAYKIVEEFYSIMFEQKRLQEDYTHGYKVYSDKNSYIIVDATVVSDAIEKSGIKEPYKIQKVRHSLGSVLAPFTLSPVENDITTEETNETESSVEDEKENESENLETSPEPELGDAAEPAAETQEEQPQPSANEEAPQ